MPLSLSRFGLLSLAGMFVLQAANVAEANPRFEFYPRGAVVDYDQGGAGEFEARITFTPWLTIKDGVVTVGVGLKRHEINRINARGIGRVEWELTLADCDSGSSIRSIKVELTGRTVKTDGHGQVKLRIGEGVKSITVNYKWVHNKRTLRFRGGRLVGWTAGNEIPKPAKLALNHILLDPKEELKRRKKEIEKLIDEIKALDKKASQLGAESEQLLKRANEKMKLANRFLESAKKERSNAVVQRLIRKAKAVEKESNAFKDKFQKLKAETSKINNEIRKLRKIAENDLKDYEEIQNSVT